MARLYTDRIMANTMGGPPDELVRVIPDGQSWVVRDIVIAFLDDVVTRLDVRVITAGADYYIARFYAADGPFQQLEVRQTVRATESIHVAMDAGRASFALTGYKFLL